MVAMTATSIVWLAKSGHVTVKNRRIGPAAIHRCSLIQVSRYRLECGEIHDDVEAQVLPDADHDHRHHRKFGLTSTPGRIVCDLSPQ